MGLRRGYTDEEWREPALELVQERICHDYCIDNAAKNDMHIYHTQMNI